jgi:hypothetical protein
MHGPRFDTEWSLGQPQRPEAGSGTLSPARPARSRSGLVERCDGKGALISGRNSDLRHFPLIEGVVVEDSSIPFAGKCRKLIV